MKTFHTCQRCDSQLETTTAGLAAHSKKCAKARPWQRDYFHERGKWPDRKVNKTSFSAGGRSRRAGRSPGNDSY